MGWLEHIIVWVKGMLWGTTAGAITLLGFKAVALVGIIVPNGLVIGIATVWGVWVMWGSLVNDYFEYWALESTWRTERLRRPLTINATPIWVH
jgi:hypothetical protein